MAVTATVQPYVSQPVSAFTTHKTISLDVDGAAGTVPVSLGVGSSTQFQTLSGSALANAVILAPGSEDRNLIEPQAGTNTALLVRPSVDNGNTFLNVQNAAGTVSIFNVSSPSGGQVLSVVSNNDGDVPLFIFPNGATGTQTEDLIATLNFDSGIFAQVRRWAIDGNSNMYWGDKTTTSARKQADIQRSWVDNTDATRKARIVHRVYDTAARETFREEATGAAPAIGFLGANAVVRQTNGTAAALAAITDANAKAFVTALSNGLVNLGLFAAPA